MIVTTTIYVLLAAIVIIWIIATEILYWKVYAAEDGIYTGKIFAMAMGLLITVIGCMVGMIIIGIILVWDKIFPIAIPIIIIIVIVVIMFVVNTQLYKKRQRDKR